jgi:peptidoglycan/LPS O-acetylase OafA/YrhL
MKDLLDDIERTNLRFSAHLNAVRFSAAGFVVLQHVRQLLFLEWHKLPDIDKNIFVKIFYLLSSFGYPSVIIFFVLSGFLVGGSVIYDIKGNTFSFHEYFIRRFIRIYIVLIPALVIGGILDFWGYSCFNQTGLYTEGRKIINWNIHEHSNIITFIQNIFNLQTITAPVYGSNGPLWSLANEFWYYVLFPLLYCACRPIFKIYDRVIITVLIAFILILLYPIVLSYMVFWILGVAIRFISKSFIRSSWLSLILVFMAMTIDSITIYDGSILARYLQDLFVAITIANYILSLMYNEKLCKFEKCKIINKLSEFSYSLYLFHFPILVFICAICSQFGNISLDMSPDKVVSYLFLVIIIVILYLYSFGFYQITEKYTSSVRRHTYKIVRKIIKNSHISKNE